MGGSSDADVRTFRCKKTSDFSVSARTRDGLSQCRHFADKGVNFSLFCADVFYERPLT